MEIIQQIGSYAGFAAVVGLAVLAGLYISQARDVKRLREWAGRAPERAPAPYQQPQRVVAQPVRQQVPPRPPVAPGASPAPAAAGAAPAVATGPMAATPAAARAGESAPGADPVVQSTVARPPPRASPSALPPRPTPPGLGGHFAREAQMARAREEAERVGREDGDADGEQDEDARPGGESPEDERLEGAHAAGEDPQDAQAGGEEPREELGYEDGELDQEEGSDLEHDQESDPDLDALPDPEDFHEGDEILGEPGPPGTGDQPAVTPPVRPPPPPITATRQPLPPRPAPPPRSPGPAQGSILPPYAQSRPGAGISENGEVSPAKVALAVGGAVVVMAAAAFGVLQVTGEDDGASEPAKPATPAGEGRPADEGKPPAKGAIDPRTVTVSVLNGTTVGGLAAELGDKLEGQGFQLGNVTNNTDQQRAESVVLFAPGAEEESKDVGRRLKIDQREPIDPDSQTRAGDATVVVVAGADLDR